jgi:hypothetical protein
LQPQKEEPLCLPLRALRRYMPPPQEGQTTPLRVDGLSGRLGLRADGAMELGDCEVLVLETTGGCGEVLIGDDGGGVLKGPGWSGFLRGLDLPRRK